MTGSGGDDRAYLGVGAAFFALAVALGITMDTWTVAVPVVALAVTFIVLGVKASPAATADDDDAGGGEHR